MLPSDAKERKEVPLYSGLLKYFPDALAAVAHLSFVGNQQHNPGQPLHWDKSKSTDHLDCLMRHLVQSGTIDSDGELHDVKVAWRALANLQVKMESAREINEAFCPRCDSNTKSRRLLTLKSRGYDGYRCESDWHKESK